MKIKHISMNMTELTLTDGTQVLFSYQTPVASLEDGEFFKTAQKWSITTTKHINKWIKAEAGPSGAPVWEMGQEYFDNLVKGI